MGFGFVRTRAWTALFASAAISVTAFAIDSQERVYSIQLGSFGTPKEAVQRASEFPGSRIDVSEDVAGQSRYRVLFGAFSNVSEAETSIVQAGLREKVPDVWVNPERNRVWVPNDESVSVTLAGDGAAGAVSPEPAVPAAEPRLQTSFPVDVTLQCESDSDESKGAERSYRTRIYLDPAQSQGELDVMLRWACEPKPEKSVARASFLAVSPDFGFTTSTSDAGSSFRSLYGFSLHALQSTGNWGPEFKYRYLRTATLKEGSLSRPAYTSRHDVQTGARFFFRGGWELSPYFGFSSTEFLLDASGGGAGFESHLMPILGLSVAKRFVQFEKGTAIWFGAGYENRFGSKDSEREIYSGTRWHAEVVLRSSLSSFLGGEGFFRYESLTQNAADLDQSDSAVLFGFTLLFGRQ